MNVQNAAAINKIESYINIHKLFTRTKVPQEEWAGSLYNHFLNITLQFTLLNYNGSTSYPMIFVWIH